MDKTPEEQYREELKKRLTEKPPVEELTYYSRTGFRKTPVPEQKPPPPTRTRPKRRFGLALMLPLLLILTMAGRMWSIVVPLALAVIIYTLITRRK